MIAVAYVELLIPALKGATYRQEQDPARAEVRGAFTKEGLTVRTRSWVDANGNLLVTQVQCEGAPASCLARLAAGGAGVVPARVADTANRLNIGREQHGGGRWYFDGELADVIVTNVVLAGKIAGEPGRPERFDGKTSWREMAPPKVDQAVSVAGWIKIAGTSSEANYIASKGELTVATDATYPPAELFAEDGSTIEGMDVDLGTAIGQVMGLKWNFVNAGFDSIIPRMVLS